VGAFRQSVSESVRESGRESGRECESLTRLRRTAKLCKRMISRSILCRRSPSRPVRPELSGGSCALRLVVLDLRCTTHARAHDESEVSSSGTPGGSAAIIIIVRQRLPSSSTAVTSCFDRPENSRRYLRLVLVNFYTTPW